MITENFPTSIKYINDHFTENIYFYGNNFIHKEYGLRSLQNGSQEGYY